MKLSRAGSRSHRNVGLLSRTLFAVAIVAFNIRRSDAVSIYKIDPGDSMIDRIGDSSLEANGRNKRSLLRKTEFHSQKQRLSSELKLRDPGNHENKNEIKIEKKLYQHNNKIRHLPTTARFTGTFTLVKANQPSAATNASIFLGRYVNQSTINVSPFYPNPLSLYVSTTITTGLSKVTLEMDGILTTEVSAPYALRGNNGNSFGASSSLLRPGPKVIVVKAYTTNSVLVDQTTIVFTIVDVNTTATTPTVPISPTKTLTRAPTKTPKRAPTRKPTSNPVIKPTISVLPTVSPVSQNLLLNGKWYITDRNATNVTARHEACFVMVDRVAVLVGGRGIKPPNIYNPSTKKWTIGAYPPNSMELNHFQCVALQNKVWIVGAWTGAFPKELNAPLMYIYDPFANVWATRQPLNPEWRRRGSAATAVIGTKIYYAFGNRGGHEQANFSTSLTWFDVYDTVTNTWSALPSGNVARDHTGGGVVNGKFCVGGGRDGGTLLWPQVVETECFDFVTQKWSIITGGNVLQKRAGSSYGTSCDGKYLLMAGGEGLGQAWKNFDMFDGTKWTRLADLNIARHGSGLAVDCVCNQIYIASGAGDEGGGPELTSVETFSLDSTTKCVP